MGEVADADFRQIGIDERFNEISCWSCFFNFEYGPFEDFEDGNGKIWQVQLKPLGWKVDPKPCGALQENICLIMELLKGAALIISADLLAYGHFNPKILQEKHLALQMNSSKYRIHKPAGSLLFLLTCSTFFNRFRELEGGSLLERICPSKISLDPKSHSCSAAIWGSGSI